MIVIDDQEVQHTHDYWTEGPEEAVKYFRKSLVTDCVEQWDGRRWRLVDSPEQRRAA